MSYGFRSESLPSLSERGRGLSELKGHEPMDRRLEVEKKERYAQQLRDQIAANADRREGSCPGSPLRLLPAQTPPTPPMNSRHSTPFHHNAAAHTADRLSEVQDVMRERIQMLQDEQHRQWQSVQNALALMRESANTTFQDELAKAREQHAAELQAMREAAREAARSASASAAEDRAFMDDLRREIGRLRQEVGSHDDKLRVHTEEIERLKVSHLECERFRRDTAHEQRNLSDMVTQLGVKLQTCVASNDEATRRLQQNESMIDKLQTALRGNEGFIADYGRALRDLAQEVQGVSQLRSDLQEVARNMGELPNQLKRLRDDMDKVANRAARDLLDQWRPEPATAPPQAPAPLPSPKMLFPAEVSEEAYALLRNSDGELYELPDLRNTIGRDPTCRVRIVSSQAVSHHHASIDIDRDGQWSVRDLASRNGTFLNDHRVSQDGCVLLSGDAVKFGVDGSTYVFEFGPAYYARWPQARERVRTSIGFGGQPRSAHSPALQGVKGGRGAAASSPAPLSRMRSGDGRR